MQDIFEETTPTNFHFLPFKPKREANFDSTVVYWFNKSLPIESCPIDEIKRLEYMLHSDSRSISSRVHRIMGPEFTVSTIKVHHSGKFTLHQLNHNKTCLVTSHWLAWFAFNLHLLINLHLFIVAKLYRKLQIKTSNRSDSGGSSTFGRNSKTPGGKRYDDHPNSTYYYYINYAVCGFCGCLYFVQKEEDRENEHGGGRKAVLWQ